MLRVKTFKASLSPEALIEGEMGIDHQIQHLPATCTHQRLLWPNSCPIHSFFQPLWTSSLQLPCKPSLSRAHSLELNPFCAIWPFLGQRKPTLYSFHWFPDWIHTSHLAPWLCWRTLWVSMSESWCVSQQRDEQSHSPGDTVPEAGNPHSMRHS